MSRVQTMKYVININVLSHSRTGLLLAESDDLPGLHVIARTEEQLRERVPGAIHELLEAQGITVRHVLPLGGGERPDKTAFVPQALARRYEAEAA